MIERFGNMFFFFTFGKIANSLTIFPINLNLRPHLFLFLKSAQGVF